MSKQGTCTACGEKLQDAGLSFEERTKMRSSIIQIAAQNSILEVRGDRGHSCGYDHGHGDGGVQVIESVSVGQ